MGEGGGRMCGVGIFLKEMRAGPLQVWEVGAAFEQESRDGRPWRIIIVFCRSASTNPF